MSLVRRKSRAMQRGIAVVTALLVVALVVSLIAGMFVRQSTLVRSLENARLRAQTRSMADSAVDAARIWLQMGARNSEVDHLGQDWNKPFTQARLFGLLPAVGRDGDEALQQIVLRTDIEDAQARFNLTNLLNQESLAQPHYVDANGVAAYSKLLSSLSMDGNLASLTAAYFLRAKTSGRALGIAMVEDLLAIPGYTPEMVEKLSRYVVILPDRSTVNVNTANAEVLAAAMPTLTVAQARQLVGTRNNAFIQNTGDLENRLRAIAPNASGSTLGRLDVKSGYFLVRCHVSNARANVSVSALVERQRNLARFVVSRVVWVRDVEAG